MGSDMGQKRPAWPTRRFQIGRAACRERVEAPAAGVTVAALQHDSRGLATRILASPQVDPHRTEQWPRTHEVEWFFFSSRRRHTRLTCDWSSDVCSSDLQARRNRGTFILYAVPRREY